MDTLSLNDTEKKILKLIHSGQQTNDALAFELLKNQPYNTRFVGALIAVALTTEVELGKVILAYVKRDLSELAIQKLEDLLTKNIRQAPLTYLQETIDRSLLVDVAYTDFKRNRTSPSEFLILDDGSHPERKDFFQIFINNLTHPLHNLFIPGLTKGEIDELATAIIAETPHPHFYRLTVKHAKTDYFSDQFFYRKFDTVYIETNKDQATFPAYIFKLSQVNNLDLEINVKMNIPKDWSALKQLKQLRLNGKGAILKDLSFLQSLPKLKSFFMGGHFIEHPNLLIAKKQIPILSRPKFANLEGYEDRENLYRTFLLPLETVLSIGAALGKSKLEQEEKERYFKAITNVKRLKLLPEFSTDDLLALMNVSHIDLRLVLQKQLQVKSERQKSADTLTVQSLLYVAGTPGRKKTEVKVKLKTLRIPHTTDFSEQVTHVLIGKNPRDYQTLQGHDFKIISENELYEIFKNDAPGFLEAAVDKGNIDVDNNIIPLLYSDELPNVRVALEMLKNGGVPDEMMDPLLVVYKSCPDAKLRGVAKKLLERNTSSEYQSIIADAQRFTNLNGAVKAQEINKKLEKLARATSRKAAAKLSLLFHERYKKGLRYILYHFHESCPERTQALQAMMEGTHLNFRDGVGFKDWRGKDPDSITFFNMKSPAKFPVDIVDHVPLIETADFHNCKFTSLPTNIGVLKNLKKIDLSFNFLGSIPKSIQEMKQLTHLNLQMNNFKTFPNTLLKMQQLQVLDFRNNRIKYVPQPLAISAEIKAALPKCEILV